jgi:CRP-like cAMP-binding protein/Fe-S-cluster-containing dehydrogenase component
MSAATMPPGLIDLTIDGQPVRVPAGTSVFDAARMNGVHIPTLCHLQNETPVGACRLCLVDTGARVLAASCVRPVEPGMKVVTNSEKVVNTRKTLLEVLMADHPSPCARQQHSHDCELEMQAKAADIAQPRFAKRNISRGKDDSSLAIAVDHDACILCDRCIRGCDEIKNNYVLGRMGKGYSSGIAFDLNSPMGESTCISCGECMVSCPTGALTNKTAVGTAIGTGTSAQVLNAEELLKLAVFKGVSGTFLELNRGAIVRRQFRKGELICHEGDFGSTAFYILEGKATVLISSPIAHVKTQGGAKGLFKHLTSTLARREEDAREGEIRGHSIPIDAASVDLSYDNPVAELGPGDLFGEMTCMNFYPRSATVSAQTDVVVYEMLRNVLDIMMRNKSFRAQVDQKYRHYALENHLRGVPMFADLAPAFIEHLKQSIELQRFGPGQVICRQGDPADSFYLIRLGFVRVSENYSAGELVIAYLSRGDYFGEIGLLGGCERTATCTALDHVELVRITGESFGQMVERFPSVRQALQTVADQRHAAQQKMQRMHSVPIEQFLSQGLMEAQSLLVLDLQNCTRCDACVNACADAHDGITRLVRDGLRFDRYLVATSCRQCRDPLCMVGCPVGSIRRRNSLEVIIEDWCIGCGLCARNCPYGNINLHPFEVMAEDLEHPGRQQAVIKQKATSCDLCTHLAEPSCVYACPHDAAHRVDPHTFFAEMLDQGSPK